MTRSIPRGGGRLACLLALLLLPWLPARPSHAQGGFATATAPAPIAGTGAIRFISQSVDATLTRGEDGLYWVDGEGVVRLHNTDRFRYATIALGWPGWPGGELRFDPNELPGFAPTKGGSRLGTALETRATAWGGEERASNWLVAQTSIAPDTRDRVAFSWRQALGEGPLLTYNFGLLPAGAWAGPVGSARVTLELPRFMSQEAIIHAEPLSYTFTGEAIEWILVEEEPTVNPTVTFVAPHLWQQIEEARAALATEPLAANLRLADLYEQLASAGATLYSAEAEAALEAARRADPSSPDPLRRLAALYRARAGRAAGPDGLPLATLEQAVSAAEAALAAGDNDPSTRAGLVEDLQQLAAAWAEDDPTLALDFLARAEAAGGDPATLAAARQPLAERLALAALADEGWEAARAIAEANGLATDVANFPWLQSASVAVRNGPSAREVALFATGDPATLDERLGGLAERLNGAGYPARWESATGTLTMQLTGDEGRWQRAGETIAAALGEDPEWDLLRDALTPATLQYRLANDPLAQRYGYREQVEIQTRAPALATQLREVAATRSSSWEAALLTEAATQWEALAASQSVHLTTHFATAGTEASREWTLTPPARETLEWRGESPRRDRWLLGLIAGALALLALLALVWLPGRRPAP